MGDYLSGGESYRRCGSVEAIETCRGVARSEPARHRMLALPWSIDMLWNLFHPPAIRGGQISTEG
jgi:hypothetical protein